MRLEILDRGYGPGTKVLFAVVRLFSGHPVPDAGRLVFYRRAFYGTRAKKFTHEVMRGASDWSVGDRELMAAYVSKINQNEFCIGAHSATASLAYRDEARVAAVLTDVRTAPIAEPLRVTLRMLGQLTREGRVDVTVMREVLSAGVSSAQVADALAVCAVFNLINRLADAFDFTLLTRAGYEAGAKYLLKRGYR